MSSVQNNSNNFLPNILGQSLDVVLINALFDTTFSCYSIKDFILSVFKSIGKFGVIIVIKSLFSGETFKIENLFQKLIRIIFYKKMVLVDQKINTGIEEKFERKYEVEFMDFLATHGCKEHPDIFNDKNNFNFNIHENRQISYLNFVNGFMNGTKMLEEEKRLKEYQSKKNRKPIVKAPKKYERKYEKEFQAFLYDNKYCEFGDYKCHKNKDIIFDILYDNKYYVSYLNYVHTHIGINAMFEEEKNLDNSKGVDTSTNTIGEDFNEDYSFFVNIKAIFDKKEEPKEPFPCYLTKNGNWILEYLPYFHNDFIENVKNILFFWTT